MSEIDLKSLSVEELKKLRSKYKDEQSTYFNLQLAKKVQLNSAYGALGTQYFRFYDLRLAESITISAQLAIRWILNDLNRFLNVLCGTTDFDYVIASDTDSVYLNMEPLVKKMGKDKDDVDTITNFVDNVCKQMIDGFIEKSFNKLVKAIGAYEQKMHMKRETIADVGLWVAKKRYMLSAKDVEGVRFSDPEIKVTGLEYVRSTTPYYFKKKLKDGYAIALRGTEGEMQEFIKRVKKDMMTQHYGDLASPTGVHDLEKYADPMTIYGKGAPMHVKAALVFNHLIDQKGLSDTAIKIKSGDKMLMLPLKMPNPTQEKEIGFLTTLPKELEIENYIDYDKQFEKAFVSPMTAVIETMSWSPTHRATLDALFA